MAETRNTTPAAPGGTVLVTGAAGFLGSRVVQFLSDTGRYRVIGTDVADAEKSAAMWRQPGVEFRRLDLRNRIDLAECVREATHVVHLAAARSSASEARPKDAFAVNIGATHDLLMLAADHCVLRFVYGSSQMLYGDFSNPERVPYREEDASSRPGVSLYGAAKLASEALLAAFAHRGGFGYAALRYGGIYGPDAAPGSNSSAMIDVLTALDRGERPVVSWSQDSQFTLIFVDDAARATVRALDVTPAPNAAVNVVGGSVTALAVYSTLVRLYGHDPEIICWRPERTRYQRVSNERLGSVLGCRTTALEQGLGALIDWHRAQR